MTTISGICRDAAGDPVAGRVVRVDRLDTGGRLGSAVSSSGESVGDDNFGDVSLLLHGAEIIDSSGDARTLSTGGGAPAVNTSQSKFGGSSIRFPGSSARIQTASSTPARLNVGLYGGTVEFFIRFNSFTSPRSHIFGVWGGSSGWTVDLSGDTAFFFGSNSAGTNSASFSALSTGVWYHFAFVFRGTNGNTIDLWIDGDYKSTTTRSTPNENSGQGFVIGARSDGSLSLDAWVDEFRVTSSVRHTSGVDFLVPTAAYPDSASTPPLGEYLIYTGGYTGDVIVYEFDPADLTIKPKIHKSTPV